MSHPIYTAQSLALLSPAALKVIAKAIGIKEPAFRKTAVISQILEFQAKAIAPATPAPRTCATCPYFDSHNDGTDRGWCTQFDKFARSSHPETQDCLNQGEKELTEQEAGEAWASFTVAAQVGDTFEIPGSPKAVVIDRYYETPSTLIFSVVLPDHNGDTLSWVLPMEPATKEVEQEWHTAQDEVLEVLERQIEEVAPEPVIKVSENVYRVLSSEGTHRYQVNTYKGTCTCPAGSWYRPCRHIELATEKQRQETEAQMLNKLPSGWREKQVTHTTPAGKETQTWFYSSSGHRTNVMPV